MFSGWDISSINLDSPGPEVGVWTNARSNPPAARRLEHMLLVVSLRLILITSQQHKCSSSARNRALGCDFHSMFTSACGQHHPLCVEQSWEEERSCPAHGLQR